MTISPNAPRRRHTANAFLHRFQPQVQPNIRGGRTPVSAKWVVEQSPTHVGVPRFLFPSLPLSLHLPLTHSHSPTETIGRPRGRLPSRRTLNVTEISIHDNNTESFNAKEHDWLRSRFPGKNFQQPFVCFGHTACVPDQRSREAQKVPVRPLPPAFRSSRFRSLLSRRRRAGGGLSGQRLTMGDKRLAFSGLRSI